MMDSTDAFSGITAFLLLAVLGCLLLLVTRNHRAAFRSQCILFLCGMTIRFLLSNTIYSTELRTVVIGDGDDGGWEGGRGLLAEWEYQELGLLDLPAALLDAFKGHHRGYFYLLAVYFFITRNPSQLSAAALGCCAGAMTAVFVYRLTHSLASEWVAWRAGWWTCLFPIMIIWSVQTIKEPFVILLEVTALYGCVQLRISKFALRHILLCGACVVMLASMRFYAAYLTGLVILISLGLPHLRRRKLSVGAAVGVVAIAFPLLYSVGAINKDTEEAGHWDLQRMEVFCQGMAKSADSGVETSFDTQTTRGLGLTTLFGGLHLLLSPFPWQLRAGSVRMAMTAPEMVVWWFMFAIFVVPGMKQAIRTRFGDFMPLLVFISLLGVLYSLTFGNIGTAYRQRAQLMPYLFIFAALRLEQWKLPRSLRKSTNKGLTKTEADPDGASVLSPARLASWELDRKSPSSSMTAKEMHIDYTNCQKMTEIDRSRICQDEPSRDPAFPA
jgi:hypothetical protein